jgi:hypothetical protein
MSQVDYSKYFDSLTSKVDERQLAFSQQSVQVRRLSNPHTPVRRASGNARKSGDLRETPCIESLAERASCRCRLRRAS